MKLVYKKKKISIWLKRGREESLGNDDVLTLNNAERPQVRTKCIFSDFWERTGASFKIECTWKGKESIKKIRF